MDPAVTFTAASLARDDVVRLHCACRVRTIECRDLVRPVGKGERLHPTGLRRELWCQDPGGDSLA